MPLERFNTKHSLPPLKAKFPVLGVFEMALTGLVGRVFRELRVRHIFDVRMSCLASEHFSSSPLEILYDRYLAAVLGITESQLSWLGDA